MAATVDFHSQIASIMEVLANAAVAEICKLVDDGYSVIQLEVSRSQKETEILRKKIKLLELQVARYRAERLKASEGSVSGRFPVTRHLLGRQGRDPSPGTSQQTKNRYLNRGARSPQPVQKPPPIILDQDPDQEVVTTTKTEPAEPEEEQQQQQGEEKEKEEDQKELVIVKVEGGMEIDTAHQGASSDADIIRGDSDPTTSFPTAMREDGGQLSETEARRRLTFPYSPKREPEKKGVLPEKQIPIHLLLDWMESRQNGDTEQPSCSSNINTVACATGSPALGLSNSVRSFPASLCLNRPGNDLNMDRPKSEPEVFMFDFAKDIRGGLLGSEGGGEEAQYMTKLPYPPGQHLPQGESTWGSSSFNAPPVSIKMADDQQHHSVSGVQVMKNVSDQNLTYQPPCTEHPEYRPKEPCLPFPCTFCSCQFSTQSGLLTHECAHTGEMFPCAQSGQGFGRPLSLRRHQRVHTGESSLPCPQCQECFSSVQDLKNHLQVHKTEGFFPCLFCEKAFSTPSRLKNHQVVHTKEKRYPCHICGKKFSRPDSRKVHQSVHTREKRFQCSTCGQRFNFLSNLCRHRALHRAKEQNNMDSKTTGKTQRDGQKD